MPVQLRRVLRGPLLLACLAGCLSFAASTGIASAAADLDAELVATPGDYYYGPGSPNPVQYTLTVTNTGDATSDARPYYFYTSLTLVGVGGDCTYHTRLIFQDYGTCNIGALTPGSSQTRHFTADLKTPIFAQAQNARVDDGGLLSFAEASSYCNADNTIFCPDPPRTSVYSDIFDGDDE